MLYNKETNNNKKLLYSVERERLDDEYYLFIRLNP